MSAGLQRLVTGLFRRLWSRHGQDALGLWILSHTDQGPYGLGCMLRLGCVFVHVPKTGGVAISRALFGNLAGGHAPLRRYQVACGRRYCRRAFKFGFVRNPWDRLVSAYEFLQGGGLGAGDAEWASRVTGTFPTFDELVLRGLDKDWLARGAHFRPQSWFVCDRSGKVGLDFTGRFERLEADFGRVAERLGVVARLCRENQSVRLPYAGYYTPEMRDKVARVYRRDIELFGYDFEGEVRGG